MLFGWFYGIPSRTLRKLFDIRIAFAEFPLLGVNVNDATYHRGYIYTTYFLSYQEGKEPIILHGNYLIKMAGDKVVEVYGEGKDN